MPQINLADPVNGQIADASLIANNNTIIENAFNGGIDSTNIVNGSITQADLAANSVGTSQLIDGSVTTAKIAGGAVGFGQLADNSVATQVIQNGAVTAAKLAAGVITGPTHSFGANPPGSPAVGDIWYLPQGTSVIWTFMYRPDVDVTYPWFFVGGCADHVVGGGNYTANGSGVWVINSTFCPGLGCPWTGYYEVSYDVLLTSSGSPGQRIKYFGVSRGVGATDPSITSSAVTGDVNQAETCNSTVIFVVQRNNPVQIVYNSTDQFITTYTQLKVMPLKIAHGS
jgi:hypothetical protein